MKWIKPNGTEIETNDRPETIEHCKALGWEEKPKRKRRTKAEIEDGRESE